LTKEQHEAKQAKKAAKKARRAEVKAHKEKAKLKVSVPMKDRKGREKAVMPPAAIGTVSKTYFNVSALPGSGGQGVRVRGRDFCDSVAVTNPAAGTTISNQPMNPTTFQGTRLAALAELYEKYRFNNFIIRAIPLQGTSSAGGYGLSYDHDPSDLTPPPTTVGIRQFMAMAGSVVSQEWMPLELRCPMMEPMTDFFVNASSTGDERLTNQGQIYLWSASAPVGTFSFFLEIEYDLNLWIPSLGDTDATLHLQVTPGGSSVLPTTYSAFNNVMAGTATGWTQNVLKGALDYVIAGRVPAGALSDGTFYGFKVPTGVWQLVTALTSNPTVLPGGTGVAWDQPAIQTVKASEQSDVVFGSDNWVQSGLSAAFPSASRRDLFYVPASGGYVMPILTDFSKLGSGSALSGSQFDFVLTKGVSPLLNFFALSVGKFRDLQRVKLTPMLESVARFEELHKAGRIVSGNCEKFVTIEEFEEESKKKQGGPLAVVQTAASSPLPTTALRFK